MVAMKTSAPAQRCKYSEMIRTLLRESSHNDKAVFILYTACWVLLNATTTLSVFWGFFLHTVHNVSVALEKHRVKQYYVQSLYDGPVKC